MFVITASFLWICLFFEPSLPVFNDKTLRDLFRAVALGPIGSWTRWGLTKIHRLRALWQDIHPPTLLANMIAVFASVLIVIFGHHEGWGIAFNDGINGSCSTVSTLFLELHTLHHLKWLFVALRYITVTILLSVFIIKVVQVSGAI